MESEKKQIETDFKRWQPVLKLVISGEYFEWYEFEIPPRVPDRKTDTRSLKTREERLQEYLSGEDVERNYGKTRKQIERLIYSNPQLTKFVTLTFADNLTDINSTNSLFHYFVGRMRRAYPGFQYMCVPEFQKRGAVHYHLLCYLPYVPAKKIGDIWSHGFIKIKRTDRVKNMAKYLTKYLTKELFDGRLFGKKKFFCSQDLHRPVTLRDEEALRTISCENGLEELYSTQFNAPFVGSVKYNMYKKTDGKNSENACKLPLNNNL